MRCIHCEKPIKPTQNTFEYATSRMIAHLDCVSLVNYADMDALLVADAAARVAERHSNTRRVYTSPTGRTASAPAIQNVPMRRGR